MGVREPCCTRPKSPKATFFGRGGGRPRPPLRLAGGGGRGCLSSPALGIRNHKRGIPSFRFALDFQTLIENHTRMKGRKPMKTAIQGILPGTLTAEQVLRDYFRESCSKAGSVRTEKKAASSRANAVKARAARAKKAGAV
jgi:hypothetical protein